jgi:hypothetical protein
MKSVKKKSWVTFKNQELSKLVATARLWIPNPERMDTMKMPHCGSWSGRIIGGRRRKTGAASGAGRLRTCNGVSLNPRFHMGFYVGMKNIKPRKMLIYTIDKASVVVVFEARKAEFIVINEHFRARRTQYLWLVEDTL